jgi:cadmium resistance protein CadD (predicted permease)
MGAEWKTIPPTKRLFKSILAIGVRRLVQIIRKDGNTSIISTPKKSINIHRPYLPFLVVAAITFSNGGDNIGIYTPFVRTV